MSRAVATINAEDDIEVMANRIMDDLRPDLLDFLKNASHAAYESQDKMHATWTGVAAISKHLKRGGEVSHSLSISSRVHIPSEKSSFDLVFNDNDQLKLELT